MKKTLCGIRKLQSLQRKKQNQHHSHIHRRAASQSALGLSMTASCEGGPRVSPQQEAIQRMRMDSFRCLSSSSESLDRRSHQISSLNHPISPRAPFASDLGRPGAKRRPCETEPTERDRPCFGARTFRLAVVMPHCKKSLSRASRLPTGAKRSLRASEVRNKA